ncbi:MAG: hypothetical protein PHN44_00505 [Candidatus Marinimicrobia bacterium]|nr:hypothetical protein [Candidatus Neomarinimicrobiota bacterium]MDD5539063.1 hypothetical protein [Candidatus Neomarinimicrobiota bacterium]
MEFKLVVQYKDGKALVGISAEGCDPIFEKVEGDIATVLGTAAVLVDTAQEKWKTAKRNPKIDIPAPAQTVPTTGSGAKSVPASSSSPGAKPVPASKSSKAGSAQKPLF